MRFQKLLIGAVALTCGSVISAQSVHIGGYVDYTSTVAAQQIQKSNTDADWDAGEVMSEFGPSQNGIHFINLDVNIPNVDFHAGMWLGSGLGPWYGSEGNMMYPDRTKDEVEPGVLNQVYLVTHFFNDQMRFYSGNFAGNGWSAGYVNGGYVSAQSHVSALAMRGSSGDNYGSNDSAFTGVELLPTAVTGLKFITGLPVAPFTDSYEKFNNWEHLCKAVKVMAQYKWLLYNVTFNAGVRPNTYGTSSKRDIGGDYTDSLFGEAFFQVDMPSLFYGFLTNFSYDIRWRDVEESGENLVDGKDWSKTAFSHMIVWSAKTTLVPGWTICVEDAAGFYDSHYISINERAFYNRIGFSAIHPLDGKPYEFGFQAYLMYGQDANGTMMSRDDAYCSDLIGFSWNFMNQGDEPTPKSGSAGRYIGGYVYPYIQKNFANGNAKLGVELNYYHAETTNTVQNFVWRVPLGLTFWW